MKKMLTLILTLLLLLGTTASAFAVGWAAPTVSATASPFAVEVIKLAVNTDATGKAYYTAFNTPGGAKPPDYIYYAIKLTLPSYADANAYYGDSKLSVGSPVWVRIDYTNIDKKTSQTCKVKLTDKAQTLWYNGKRFEASWVAAVNNDCGCGDKHILKDEVKKGGISRVRACVAARGELSDVRIGGCYSVEEKAYRGVKPCVNCKPVNLKGFLFSGDCAAYKVFFSTDSKGKITGIYCTGDAGLERLTQNGTFEPLDAKLYGWAPAGTAESCVTGKCELTFALAEIPAGAKINTYFDDWDVSWGSGYDQFIGKDAVTNKETKGYFAEWVKNFSPEENGTAVQDYDFDKLYIYKDGVYEKAVGRIKEPAEKPLAGAARIAPYGKGDAFDDHGYMLYWSDTKLDEAETEVRVFDAQDAKFATMYPYGKDAGAYWNWPNFLSYGHIYYFRAGDAEDAGNSYLFKMLATDKVDCDTNDASYLNSINHVLQILGFTYQEVAAGSVYMTKEILLSNFGFNSAACAEALWNH